MRFAYAGSCTRQRWDPFTAALFVRVIAENSEIYSVSTHRTLLKGIFQLTDVCEESLNEREDASHYENLKTSLGLVRLFASDALKHGNLAEGLRAATECFAPATLVPARNCLSASETVGFRLRLKRGAIRILWAPLGSRRRGIAQALGPLRDMTKGE